MEPPAAPRNGASCQATKGGTVGLLRRKDKTEPEPVRCPVCNERVPDDADEQRECAMCGADLRALLPS